MRAPRTTRSAIPPAPSRPRSSESLSRVYPPSARLAAVRTVVQHERLMRYFAHEHLERVGPGAFRLSYRFPAPGRHRAYADVAPKDAGAQVLTGEVLVSRVVERDAPPPAPRTAASLALPRRLVVCARASRRPRPGDRRERSDPISRPASHSRRVQGLAAGAAGREGGHGGGGERGGELTVWTATLKTSS